jgi:hypothetical protein
MKVRLLLITLLLLSINGKAQSIKSAWGSFTPYESKAVTKVDVKTDSIPARFLGMEQPGRFLSVDPLYHKYPSWSPYVYTANNPLIYIDPDGRDFYRHDESGAVIWRDSNDESINSNDLVYTNLGQTYQYDVDGVNFVMFQTGSVGEMSLQTVEMFENPTGQDIRNDGAGSGEWLANRDGGSRPHRGIDILSTPGQNIVAPFNGVSQTTQSGGISYTGTAPTGANLQLTYVYTTNTNGTNNAQRGSAIGTANNMVVNYRNPMMQNHVHIQLNINGVRVNPTPFFFSR